MRKLFIITCLSICLFIQSEFSYAQTSNKTPAKNSQYISLVGEIEARTQVSVFTKTPGKVEKLNVEVGDSVRKNDVLAIIEHDELALNVRQAKAVLEMAQSVLVQAKALSELNVTSKAIQAQSAFSAAKVTYDQVKALSYIKTSTQIAQAEAGLEAIKANMQKIKAGAREEEKKQVEATVEQAKSALDNAKSNYDRIKALFDQNAVSKQTLEGMETQFNVANSQYKAAEQQLKLVNEGARKEDIQAVEAQVKQAESALQMAKTLGETKDWEKDATLAEAQLNQAEAMMKLANASVESKSWEADITKANTAVEQATVALELAQKQLSYATITAPISGIISKRYTELGAMASQQLPMFEIIDIDVVKAKVSIVESDLYKIKIGDEALVSVDALKEPLKGKVTLISPVLDRMTHTTTIEITIDNKDYKLKPGMFARAKVTH
jgi:multidrug resistance efflux pump